MRRDLRAALLHLALGAPALCLLATCAPPSPREQLAAVSGWPAPVVLVVLDTLRLDHTSLGGCARDTTPFLAELARHSIVFDHACAPASWTRPSMASLFSSRLPAGHGCEGRAGRLAADVKLLPELLRDAGYDTRAVQTNGNLATVYGFDRGFNAYKFVKGRPLLPYADAALLREFVEDSVRQMQPPPFLLYLHYVDAHDPYLRHPENDWDPGYSGTFDGSERSLQPFRTRRPSAANLQRVVDLYDGEIAWLDGRLREMFAWLLEQGVLDHCWVIVTSDHGEGLWQHVIQAHADEVYEQQLRVPLIVRPPGGLDRPLHVPEPFSLIDLAPTLLQLLGLPACEDFDGRSWAACLLHGAPPPERPVIAQTLTEASELDAITDGRFKLIVDRRTGRRSLFDLQADPLEQHSLLPDPPGRDERAPSARAGSAEDATARTDASALTDRLQRELEAALAAARARCPDREAAQLQEVPEDVRLQLQALGYVNGGG